MSAELNSADTEKLEIENEALPLTAGEETSEEAAVEAVAEEAPEEAAVEVVAEEAPEEATVEAVAVEAVAEEAVGDAGAEAAEPTEDEAEASLEGSEQVEKIRGAMQSGSSVKGKVIGWNDGGLHVVVNDVAAFCPHSEMELGKPLDPSEYVDQSYDFFVLRIEKAGKRIVLSRVSHLRQEQKEQQAATRGAIEVGAELTGKVVSVKDFGAFVDLGGVQGLVHISELARRRVERTEDVVKPGDDVKVKVLKLDKGGRRISLSMKALEPDPWRDVSSKYKAGAKVDGKVEKVERFGAFIELEPGLSGLLPSSKMLIPAGTTASRVFRPGRVLTVQVLTVDSKRQRISLGLEGDGAEGSRGDYEAYRSNQEQSEGGFGAMAAALSKFK